MNIPEPTHEYLSDERIAHRSKIVTRVQDMVYTAIDTARTLASKSITIHRQGIISTNTQRTVVWGEMSAGQLPPRVTLHGTKYEHEYHIFHDYFGEYSESHQHRHWKVSIRWSYDTDDDTAKFDTYWVSCGSHGLKATAAYMEVMSVVASIVASIQSNADHLEYFDPSFM